AHVPYTSPLYPKSDPDFQDNKADKGKRRREREKEEPTRNGKAHVYAVYVSVDVSHADDGVDGLGPVEQLVPHRKSAECLRVAENDLSMAGDR
ncbi:hypothetical protein V3C99_011952, partial [Haemonchus contortus]